jgi:hypothetical protein
MESYAQGLGHVDLAAKLGIEKSQTLAIGGSANSRILRTSLKHSYQVQEPTFYVLGMTFLSRLEIPILDDLDQFEGRWTNPQNQQFVSRWQQPWTQRDTDLFVELKLKSEVYSILDRLEDLMYRVLSVINDLKSRGHGVLVYQQADNIYQDLLGNNRLTLFGCTPEIVQGYAWRAVAWQHSQGVPGNYNGVKLQVPPDMVHPKSGHHEKLNEFLVNYIRQHHLIDHK